MNMVDQEGFQISKRSSSLRQCMPDIYFVDIYKYDQRDGGDRRKFKVADEYDERDGSDHLQFQVSCHKARAQLVLFRILLKMTLPVQPALC